MKPGIHKAVATLVCGLILAGCQTASTKTQPQSLGAFQGDLPQAESVAQWRQGHRKLQATAPPSARPVSDLWTLTRENLKLEPVIDQPSVDDQLKWYLKHSRYMAQASERAESYYYFVLSEVLERNLPAELALLPFIESGYNPQAVSPSHAAGAWQFIPSTAALFGLKSNWWYDGRRDIVQSTDAALDYLEYLNDRFEGDWLLALAAYNCGEGCIARAVKRNTSKGKATDYWHLSLPRETRRYIPKLIAVARLVKNADQLGVELPKLNNTPYFDIVDLDGQIDLAKAASLAGVELDEIKRLNPGFSRWATDPEGPHRLLVPVANADRLREGLSNLPPSERVRWAHYQIKSGDTLSGIAAQFNTSVAVIRKSNKLDSNRIRAGKSLLIPSPGNTVTSVAARQQEQGKQQVHRVSSGDNLWKIAQRYGVSTEQLADWNSISDVRSLRPGQDLILYPESRDPG
ncbi:LysM peptidoglycan-binding domain-containing protein [Marinobacterium sp. D7]|uniref:LysM peptidoglycan-binding domain-containing protein n=1 Tax=Marinobacterium ramblicola TaxID=2849041 RepID=UPI001C2DA17D|nr:LysM peptidoglycan-binding domain-containing protein [Marinobacterium ramblicola]MBV1789166.1 LysM peptidoglycan-binding domain-containing protein [Marinobacterium ramblicola]